jgi:hypothetical protein
MSAFYDLASLVVVPSGYKSGKVYAQKPLTTDGQLAFTRASTATRVNASGLIETVASGVPRLDYLNSTCPKLLLEPQRTNSSLSSSDLTGVGWINQTSSTTITTVASGAPSGGAFTRLVTTASGYQGRIVQVVYDSDTAQTFSIYVKGTGKTQINLFMSGGGNFTSAEITLTSSWQRISVSGSRASGATGDFEIRTFGGNTLDIWGAQLEVGAYATSYIPTTTAAVTRVADAIDKTGISSLIGQTEGTLFADVVTIAGSPDYHTMYQIYGDSNNRVAIGIEVNTTNIFGYINAGGVVQFFQIATKSAGSHKIALAYKSGSVALYIDGALAFSNANTFTFGTTLSRLFGNNFIGSETGIFKTNQMLLFKTRLTNAQLAELTA